ncbi:MD-2-related lipid-recognition protein-like [Bacillus rossius redtenbacheri]|uniref:MD-2-related lipid-recognition protein-like n=1 Tax=Bacillus rossius redtenbacheri TaxID=93214 RepID=UPI002FDDF05B
MMLKRVLVVPAFFLLIHFCAAEEVRSRTCPPISEEYSVTRNCTVDRVHIEPCPQAASNQPCQIHRRHQATISFHYTPGKSPVSLQSQAYWASGMDLPFAGMDTNACSYTSCDGAAGQEHTYSYSLTIPNKARPRQYDVKWKLWNDEMECCFIVTFVVPSKRN